jgi:Rad3-related DNA helicase
MNITGFEEPKDGSVIAALKKIRDAGGNAWDEVTDPEARIAEMRGR